MSECDEIIEDLFSSRWHGDLSTAPLSEKKSQLFKTLSDQLKGYWSGHTAYNIAVDGGFLKDSKFSKKKELTQLGKMFMKKMENCK